MSEHTHDHQHPHVHSHEHTAAVSNRLARAIGHLEAVRKMVEDNRDCSEVLIQLAAVRSALASTSRIILKDHMEHCIVDAIEEHDQTALDELNRAIDKLLK
ncbi:MAG: metal-sensing transcriptional repressor [Oscillospiraceae bacterium]|nr:metal-sensing transcriptional repressor [Oscillospiraceae bacterium]